VRMLKDESERVGGGWNDDHVDVVGHAAQEVEVDAMVRVGIEDELAGVAALGDVVGPSLFIGHWWDVSQPGKYTILGQRRDGASRQMVKAAPVTVSVTE
jgi:hypothetical protein